MPERNANARRKYFGIRMERRGRWLLIEQGHRLCRFELTPEQLEELLELDTDPWHPKRNRRPQWEIDQLALENE